MKDIYTQIGSVGKRVEDTVAVTGNVIKPIRESLFKRFPTISILLVTFGVAATLYGIERMIAEVPWLNERPVVIFGIGVLILIVSGRLYKKLG